MTVATLFRSWQYGLAPGRPYDYASPNLVALRRYMVDRWQLRDLGCYGRRPIRGGTMWSSHAFGAAVDLGYTDRREIEDVIIPWLLANSAELGIQRVHDYAAKRYWQAGRGWILRPPGAGGNWLHIETHHASWENATPITERLDDAPTSSPKYPGKVLKHGSTGKAVELVQAIVGAKVDGDYGAATERLVTEWQTAHELEADGRVGRLTWAAMFPTG